MTAKKKDNELEEAMAEALAAVERAEQTAPKRSNRKKDPALEDSLEFEDDAVEVEAEESEETEENEGLRSQLLRVAADFENYRKRADRQLEEVRRFGNEKLLRDLLPVMDNLERALQHAPEKNDPVLEGIRMVAKQFLDVLMSYGVKGFGSRGEPFDPERHEAMGKAPSKEHAPGTVVEEMCKGYFLHDRLLRAAQVTIATDAN